MSCEFDLNDLVIGNIREEGEFEKLVICCSSIWGALRISSETPKTAIAISVQV